LIVNTKEEGRRKKEEGRRKKEEGRRKKKKIFLSPNQKSQISNRKSFNS
jgi:hypothetical protein